MWFHWIFYRRVCKTSEIDPTPVRRWEYLMNTCQHVFLPMPENDDVVPHPIRLKIGQYCQVAVQQQDGQESI